MVPVAGCARLCYATGMPTLHQTNRWKHDRPPSLQQFMATFPDDAACAEWLDHRRWPDGFVCPACSGRKGWKLEAKPWTWECAGCGRQTSTTAGTMMHRTHLPLRTWFLAAHLVATHLCYGVAKVGPVSMWNELNKFDSSRFVGTNTLLFSPPWSQDQIDWWREHLFGPHGIYPDDLEEMLSASIDGRK